MWLLIPAPPELISFLVGKGFYFSFLWAARGLVKMEEKQDFGQDIGHSFLILLHFNNVR